MRRLRPSELAAILGELQRQGTIEELNEQKNKWNLLAAATINSTSAICAQLAGLGGRRRKPKLVEPEDLMSKDAKKLLRQLLRQNAEVGSWDKHIEDAKAKGLSGPWG